MVTGIGEPLLTDFQVHELPTEEIISRAASTVCPLSLLPESASSSDTNEQVSKALLSRIEYLEADFDE